MTSFAPGFLWGAATAGHQIEGNNLNADLWAAEWSPDSFFVEPSGDACDSYHRYGEDVALLADAGLNAYRFSIEWSRIEPEDGWFSDAALDHYRRVLGSCGDHGITPMVTYNHFTTPKWFAQNGGWAAPDAPERFGRYCERVTHCLGDLIPWACTLNEPNVMATITHIGIAPIGGGDATDSAHPDLDADVAAEIAVLRHRSHHRVPPTLPGFQSLPVETMAAAHRRAVDAIKSGPGEQQVGWSLALIDLQAVPGGEERCTRARDAAQLQWLDVAADDDFVGVQTYTRERMGPNGLLARPTDAPRMLTGWEVYPQALQHTVRQAAERGRVPVIVTENGCATDDDALRISYTSEALRGLAGCVADGVDVRGYLHWSLLDNFEWVSGFAVTFGLVAVDRRTFERIPKPSLAWIGDVARRNTLAIANAE
jgi:beta-glucosidase